MVRKGIFMFSFISTASRIVLFWLLIESLLFARDVKLFSLKPKQQKDFLFISRNIKEDEELNLFASDFRFSLIAEFALFAAPFRWATKCT